MTLQYIVWNAPMPTTAAVLKVTTGTSIITMLQLRPATNFPITIQEWGFSADGFAAAAPATVELLVTGTVFATVTAHAAAGIMPFHDPNAPVNTAGTGGIPMNLGTTHTGFTSTSEGTITATEILDAQLFPPTGIYVKQFPLGREPGVAAGDCLRVRCTFAAAVNALCYVVFEV